jgi:hypothetical protein
MSVIDWPPRVGAWYLRWDKGEVVQVTSYDEKSHKATIQTYTGNVGEIDQPGWDGAGMVCHSVHPTHLMSGLSRLRSSALRNSIAA